VPNTYSFLAYRTLLRGDHVVDRFAARVTRSGAEENQRGEFVLYWSQMARRMRSNLALDYAIERANTLGLPVVVYESLRPDCPSANDRLHTFVLQGAAQNRSDAAARGLRHHFFLPRTANEARGVLQRLSARARLVVTDEYPTFIAREQTARFATRCPVALHLVDNNGIVPMRMFAKEQYSARFLRDRAHRMFPDVWSRFDDVEPRVRPFSGELDLPEWNGHSVEEAVASCDIDHGIAPVATRGGREAALHALEAFVTQRLTGYAEGRNRSYAATSGLSPYLHFGFISIHEIAARVLASDAPAEDVNAFLEEAIVRRELSFNLCHYRSDHHSLSALPDWAKKTLDAHRHDRRKPSFTADELEQAQTYDEVWNLAQRELLACGTMFGYLRMLWGKKMIEWCETPEEAHALMLRFHERYALDGRDPNTHAGVLWCFGKHDRPWAPQRPIFGSIRYMSSTATRRKIRLRAYEEHVTAQYERAMRGAAHSS
jgi:deoxyribodipyrimidine photo-lyase